MPRRRRRPREERGDAGGRRALRAPLRGHPTKGASTLQGGEVSVEGSGEDVTVNGNAAVLCGNVETANATVYLIDGVLQPPS